MTLCSDGHEEVCYDGSDCPVCEKQEELDDVQEDLDAAEEKIKELEEQITNLENGEDE